MKKTSIFITLVIVMFFTLCDCSSSTPSERSIELPEHQIYLDINFEQNLLFAKYDVEVYVDDTEIGTVEHGKNLTHLATVDEGAHTIIFYKATDNSVKATKEIKVVEYTTYKFLLHSNKSSLDIKEYETVSGITGNEITMIDVVGLTYAEAKDKLADAGVVYIDYITPNDASVWSGSKWQVVAQNIKSGEIIDKNTEIILSCEKLETPSSPNPSTEPTSSLMDKTATTSEPIISPVNITRLSFSRTEDISLKTGESATFGFLNIQADNPDALLMEDIELISDDPAVAEISFSATKPASSLSCKVVSISAGQTIVYARAKNSDAISEKIKVNVSDPVSVEGVSLDREEINLILDASINVNATVLPENADDRTIQWSTSDESVAIVDDTGRVSSVSAGSATITAQAANGVSASVPVIVTNSRRMIMNMTRNRTDDVNIGKEWSYIDNINGEYKTKEYILTAGDTLAFRSQYTEDDSWPDIGETYTEHTVTEDDLNNGFTVDMELTVTENGGKNTGKTARFEIEYVFTPSEQ